MAKKRKEKLWSLTVGGHGHTVAALERTAGGNLYLRWWDPTAAGGRAKGGAGNWRLRSLGHRDQEVAEAEARELSAQILAAGTAQETGRITILDLFASYEAEVSKYKKGAQPKEDQRRIDLWTVFLGGTRSADNITHGTLKRFVRARRAGRIKIPPRMVKGRKIERKLSANPSDGTIGADIIFLQAVLNWAVSERLLGANPADGFDRPKARNPQRPVADHDRFDKVRAQADGVDQQGLFGAFFDLIEALGWRVSATCQIRRSDVDRRAHAAAPYGRIRKRGEVDKEGMEMWVPLSESARAAIDAVLGLRPVIGEAYLFPAPKRKGRPWSRWHARDLLERAEKAAGVEPQEGGQFHPYRRAWATVRKHLPAQDVAAAGGWRDLRSLENCYQQVDDKTLLAVVLEPRKLRSAIANAITGDSEKGEAPTAKVAAGA